MVQAYGKCGAVEQLAMAWSEHDRSVRWGIFIKAYRCLSLYGTTL